MTNESISLYFAYGSNMCSARLRERVPSATVVTSACLMGHSLRWHKKSRDGSGKCDVELSAEANDQVWGVLYEIAVSEESALDRAEDLGQGYEKKAIEVDTPAGVRCAYTYIATEKEESLRPYDWYHALVVAGAEEHHLPRDYIVTLKLFEPIPDPDSQRAFRNLAVLKSPGLVDIEDPLKPLDQMASPDSRQHWFAGTLADQHAELAEMVLQAEVPRDVRQLFETAKNVSLYSWYVYPFHPIAELVAFSALEMALRVKWEATAAAVGQRSPSLRRLLTIAHKEQWLVDQRFDMLSAVAERRVRDRSILEKILAANESRSKDPIRFEEQPVTESQIQSELQQLHFVEHLAGRIPHHRNLLAHGSSLLHPNSRHSLRLVAQAINQLFPTR